MNNNIVRMFIACTVMFFIAPVSLYFIFNAKAGKVNISNYSDYTETIPSGLREGIDEALYRAVELNLSEGEKMITSSASIRKKTPQSSYNNSTNITSGSFIVDLKDIRQSYKVFYDWSADKDNPGVSGTPIAVNCLSSDDRIYKDFKCIDGSESSGLSLEYQLPFTDISGPFEIEYMHKQETTPVIGIFHSTPDGRQKALDWLRSKNINPTNIVINYLDINDRLGAFRYGIE
jgi:hypothetical protein